MNRTITVSLAAIILTLTVVAQPALAGDDAPDTGPPPATPTSEEVNKVVQYFLKGAPVGPVLMEATLCKKTEKVEGKLACVEKLPAKIKKGEAIIAFVRFFVPKGAKYDDTKVKFLLDGEVRSTSDFTLSEAWTGYSNYKQTTASKAGTWEVQILRGDTVLNKQTVVVE